MNIRLPALILIALFQLSLVSGFGDENFRILLDDNKTKTETPGKVDPKNKSPPEMPSINPRGPDVKRNSSAPPNSHSNSPSFTSGHSSRAASPAPLPTGVPPETKSETRSADKGNSKGNSTLNDECPSSMGFECHFKNLTVCLRKDSNNSVLIIQNNGEIPLNLTVFTPTKTEIYISKHSTQRVSVNTEIKGNQSIQLNVGIDTCTINLAPQKSKHHTTETFPRDVDHITPLHGVYVASFSIILVGCLWGCYKLRKRNSGVNSRVAYQQLEMSSEPPLSSWTNNENRKDGWNDHWNDDWDEEEAQGRTARRKSLSNRSDWEDWDD